MGVGMLFTNTPGIVFGFFFAIVAYGLSRTPYWKIAGLIIVILLAIPSLMSLVTGTPEVAAEYFSDWTLARLVWLALPMMLASILFSWRSSFLYNLGLMGACFLAETLNPQIALSDMIVTFSVIGILSALIVLASYHQDIVEHDRRTQLIQTNKALLETTNMLEKALGKGFGETGEHAMSNPSFAVPNGHGPSESRSFAERHV